jgi:hypothetical protein
MIIAMTRLSKFDAIAQPERLQLIGLVTLAQQAQEQLDYIEAAMLSLTGELERDGSPSKVGDGGHSSDAVYQSQGTRPTTVIDQLLDRLSLPVIEVDD